MRIVTGEPETQGKLIPQPPTNFVHVPGVGDALPWQAKQVGQPSLKIYTHRISKHKFQTDFKSKFPNAYGAISALGNSMRTLHVVSSNNPRSGMDDPGEGRANERTPQAKLQYFGPGAAQGVAGGTQQVVPAFHAGFGGLLGAGVQSPPPRVPIANPEQGREGVGAYVRAPHMTRFGPHMGVAQQVWGQTGTPLYNQRAMITRAHGTTPSNYAGFAIDYRGLETGERPFTIPRQHRIGLGAQAGLLQHGTQQSWDFMATGSTPSGNGTGIITPRIGRGTEASRAGFRQANPLFRTMAGRPPSLDTARIPSTFVPRSI